MNYFKSMLSLLCFVAIAQMGISQNEPVPPTNDCHTAFTDYWNDVMSQNWDTQVTLNKAIKVTDKKHAEGQFTCVVNECGQHQERFVSHLKDQAWANKASFFKVAERAQSEFARMYPKCIASVANGTPFAPPPSDQFAPDPVDKRNGNGDKKNKN